MKNLTWQNPEQLFVAQELINKVKSKCCGIKGNNFHIHLRGWSINIAKVKRGIIKNPIWIVKLISDNSLNHVPICR